MNNLGFPCIVNMLQGMAGWNAASLPTTAAFAPLLMAVGAVLGIVLATYMIYRRLQATPKSTPARRNRK
jgi:hypothetical protein